MYLCHRRDVSVRLLRLEVCLSIVELKMLLQSDIYPLYISKVHFQIGRKQLSQ